MILKFGLCLCFKAKIVILGLVAQFLNWRCTLWPCYAQLRYTVRLRYWNVFLHYDSKYRLKRRCDADLACAKITRKPSYR